MCVCVCVRGEREMGRGGGLGESGLKDACHVWILEQETGTGADFKYSLIHRINFFFQGLTFFFFFFS